MVTLSAEQERARQAVYSWYRSPHRKPWFFLTGAAGCGKSTVTTAITDRAKGLVLYAAPTGKAAQVMASKGCTGAQTIHSLIYKPNGIGGDRAAIARLQEELVKLDPASPLVAKLEKDLKGLLQGVKPLFTLNPDSRLRDASLLVVDEISMAGEEIIQDLLSFGVPLLLLGDPYQLPPVMAKSFFKVEEADFCLTEVHRQAKDSPIIQLATLAREGKPLPDGQYGDSLVTRDVPPELAIQHDQIIVGTNETRHGTNRKVRGLLGFTGDWPNPGERVICRRNNNQLGLMNGDQFEVTSFDLTSNGKAIIGVVNDALNTRVMCHTELFTYTEKQRKGRTVLTTKEVDPWNVKSAESFEYSFSITCHSSQGSQWNSVFVLDQGRIFGKDASKWRYTAITRAAERVTIKLT